MKNLLGTEGMPLRRRAEGFPPPITPYMRQRILLYSLTSTRNVLPHNKGKVIGLACHRLKTSKPQPFSLLKLIISGVWLEYHGHYTKCCPDTTLCLYCVPVSKCYVRSSQKRNRKSNEIWRARCSGYE